MLHHVPEPRAFLEPREEPAAHAFGAAMLDQRRDQRLQRVGEAVDRVGRAFFERADVDLPLDARAVGVEVGPHQCQAFEHLDAKTFFFSSW